jgi:hypothetical protein
MLYVTAKDLQDQLIRQLGGNAGPEEVEDVRRASRQALRKVSSEHVWPFYHDYYHLITSEPYDTGTLTYTASTRVATLSGGTFPSWAASGVLIVDDEHARVESRDSSTQVTLKSDDAPDADYSGTYEIYQYQYELPAALNVYKFGRPQVDQATTLEYTPPDLFETDVRLPYLASGDRPRWFTVSRGATPGRTVISLWPYPSEALRLRFGYLRHPRDILTWEYSEETVSTTSGSAAVTGTSTAFTSSHANCLLRTGSNRNDKPTHRDGRYPPVDEVVVKSRTSATALVAAESLSATATDVAFTLSDVLDYDTATMQEVVSAAARYRLGFLRSEDPKVVALHKRAYDEALYHAKCTCSGDNTVQLAGRNGGSGWGMSIWDDYLTFGGG